MGEFKNINNNKVGDINYSSTKIGEFNNQMNFISNNDDAPHNST